MDPEKIVFVTATSSNHFTLVRGMIEKLRKYHAKNQIVFYDLGINKEEVRVKFFGGFMEKLKSLFN